MICRAKDACCMLFLLLEIDYVSLVRFCRPARDQPGGVRLPSFILVGVRTFVYFQQFKHPLELLVLRSLACK